MRRFALIVALMLVASPAFAGPYLFELLEIKAYRAGWNAMFKGEKNVPSWLTNFNKTMDGVSTPSEDIEIDGQPYVYSNVCKPHDCGDNMVHVVFSVYDGSAFGLVADANGKRLLGKPDAAIADALKGKAGQ